LASVEQIASGAVSSVVDLTRGDGANVTPTPGKRSALALVAEEREESGRALKKVKTEKLAVEDELEDAQELAGDLHKSENNKMTTIDGLEERIRELERAAALR
jgi:hypothetical protein